MKKIPLFMKTFMVLWTLTLANVIMAQSPNLLSYQAVVRNATNGLIANQAVGVRITVLQNSASGTEVYKETFGSTTNANGLLSLNIGGGTVVSGNFSTINWGSGPYFVKTEIDPAGGTSYSLTSTSQLLSVPYALSAKTAQTVAGIAGTTNKVAKFTPSGTQLGDSQLFDGATGVGVGTILPAYKLDVEHLGSTGVRSRSTSGYSVIDIDGFNGDAALRFASNGVNKWNVRNQPSTDGFQVTELGGFGQRFLIQSGTGNVAVGASVPAYRLDVEHAGSTGIRSKSTNGYSVIDIDGFNGDAALRFGNNGVNKWNLRNQPSTDDFQLTELGGLGQRFLVQSGTGNVAIGNFVPSYKFDVEHGGNTGIRSRSLTGYSIIDIDGFNGDAALRFASNGVNQWNVRNQPTTDNFQIFELGGGGERLVIQNTTGNVGVNMATPTARLHVGGNFTATGAKAFTIDHPLDPENKLLRHFSIESNEVLNVYSGNAKTDASGKVMVKLPAYFDAINKDFRYQLTVIGTFAQAIVSKKIAGNQFEISTNQPNVEVSWEVKGVRNDAFMKNVNTMKAEESKPADMVGKYIEPKAYNLPESRGVNFDSKSQTESSLNSKTVPAPSRNTSANSGGSLETKKAEPVKKEVKKTTEKTSIDN